MMKKDMGAFSSSRASHEAAKASSPSGFDPARMESRLSELLALEFDWNSYRAKPIDPACAERVRRLFPVMESLGLQPWITPNTHGGLAIERAGTDDYLIEFDPNGTAAVWFDGLSDADAWAFVGLFAQLKALDAIAMEAAKPSRRETGSTRKGDSAGPQDIAQEDVPGSDMGKGE